MFQIRDCQNEKIMNRPIAILLLVLIIVGMLFSTFALFQGKFVEALLVYPLLVFAYVFSRRGKK
jgi:phosphoglycerol transferase MdoB-like AlkP superfamily enzyme